VNNIILSMKNENREKESEFMGRLEALMKKYKYYVSTRKEDEREIALYGDMSCWYNKEGQLVYLTELPKLFENVDDSTGYRSHNYLRYLEELNLNYITFDVKNGMKYKSETLRKVYEKIVRIHAECTDAEEKNLMLEEAFAKIVEYEGSLEIFVREENGVISKSYKIHSAREEELKRLLYRILLKHKYHVDNIASVLDFTKWHSNKTGNSSLLAKTLKYYFDDIVDDDAVRLQLFLHQRNKKMNDIVPFYQNPGMGYDEIAIAKVLENARSVDNKFYQKLFQLMLDYQVIISIKKD